MFEEMGSDSKPVDRGTGAHTALPAGQPAHRQRLKWDLRACSLLSEQQAERVLLVVEKGVSVILSHCKQDFNE